MSCLEALGSYTLNSSLSPLILRIKVLFYSLSLKKIVIQFLWVPDHVGIIGNETADQLAKKSAVFCCPSAGAIPWSDFCPLLKSSWFKSWSAHWKKLPVDYAT